MQRPLFSNSIEELERSFANRKADADFLHLLLDELAHRSTQRALRLKAQVIASLSDSGDPGLFNAEDATALRAVATHEQPEKKEDVEMAPSAAPMQASTDSMASEPYAPVATPGLTNAPDSILTAWTALEVLSPQGFRRETDLAGGDASAIVKLDASVPPWKTTGGGRKNFRLYYQVVLGTINLDAAVAALVARYGDTRVERFSTRGEGVIATIMLDKQGVPVDESPVSISSFAWGVPKALTGNLSELGAWQVSEQPLIDDLTRLVIRKGDDGETLPLDHETIHQAYKGLINRLQLPQEFVQPPRFAVRTYQYYKNSDPPEPLLLNSFFLSDLSTARRLWREGNAPANLRSYLGENGPAERADLLHDEAALADAVSPGRFPTARWPSPGRHPLVLLQQAAINLATSTLKSEGILAVNGPPGTGKTTLLRDIVAAVVAQRAEVMAGYADPADAFTNSSQRLNVGNAWIHLYRLDPRLRGFEILVASSNNKAVENVSAELPGQGAVAADASDLRYFKTLSDGLLGIDTWGLIAAVLGNAKNRSTFRNTFWWDEDLGLAKYLAHASGTPQSVEIINDQGEVIGARPPHIIQKENAPRDHRQALQRWDQARKAFRLALERSRQVQKQLHEAQQRHQEIPQIQRELLAKDEQKSKAYASYNQAKHHLAAVGNRLTELKTSQSELRNVMAQSVHARPNLFARIFGTGAYREWSLKDSRLRTQMIELNTLLKAAEAAFTQASNQLKAAEESARSADVAYQALATHLSKAIETVARARSHLGARFIDEHFADRDHVDRHQCSPWYDDNANRVRDDLFVSAIALHKAFIDCAAKPLRHNLGALMNIFAGRKLADPAKSALVPDLWSSLFLVVPAVSTTFASVERMLGALPPESLGWLLIDEAGQALPQAAVGALLRTRRAVVVGDPMQIEPVVVLPDVLTQAICRTFGIDPDRFNAPIASVQTLADAATPYVAEFASRQGSRTVGVPLLVHRRCANPMFSISNAIAYEHLMVHATPARLSAIRERLGPSRWFDIQGTALEKWCPEEGQKVLDLLQTLKTLSTEPDVYIVTPFVVVQDNLRSLIRNSGILHGWVDDPGSWIYERVGTVHTVQGREAEAVIFVLGAPAMQQTGARGWAGARPNLLNVATTRAKEVFYVVGNRELWRQAGVFRELDARLPA